MGVMPWARASRCSHLLDVTTVRQPAGGWTAVFGYMVSAALPGRAVRLIMSAEDCFDAHKTVANPVSRVLG